MGDVASGHARAVSIGDTAPALPSVGDHGSPSDAGVSADAMRVALVWRGSIDVSTKDAPEIASLFVTAADSGAAHAPEALVGVGLALRAGGEK